MKSGLGALSDRIFAPQWAAPWTWARWWFVIVGALTQGPRCLGIGDVWGVTDMVISGGAFRITEYVILSAPSAWLVWALSLLSLVGVAVGGRWAKPCVVAFLVFMWLMLGTEVLNVKAYDRLLTMIGFCMLFGPIGEYDLAQKWRSPIGRYLMIIVFMAIYGSTGWLKALEEPEWWTTGRPLGMHLLHWWFGSKALGVWISGQKLLLLAMSWMTVICEAGFPFLIWFRRTNPWLLIGLLLMHIGILVLLNVGPFSYVAVAAYPVLLHPEVARSWYESLRKTFTAAIPALL